MKLVDYGSEASRSWFQQVLEWSKKKITFDDNIDCVFISAYVGTTETIVDHALGRTPKGIIPVLAYPNNTSELSWTQAPTPSRLYIKQRVAGNTTLMIF